MGVLKKKVIMFQLPYQEIRSYKQWGNSPWGAAMLKAMAHQAGLADFFDIEILPTAFVDNVGDAWLIDYLEAQKPDVLCATLYLWNSQRSLHIAEQLKTRLPNLLFIVGGPEVCESSSYIVENTIVGYGCIGEGEEVFVAILRAIAEGVDPPPLSGLFWKRDGRTMLSSGRGCIADLDIIPSPLQMGIVKPWNKPIVTYETMRGCPCSCSYCVTGTMPWRNFSADRVVADLSLLYGYRVKKIRLSCSNFLLHPEFFDICDRLARINADRSVALACFSYAEHVTREKAEALKSCNIFIVEIGLQTVNAKTLRIIRRPPFDETRFLEGLGHLRNAGIDCSIDLIAGLPEESPQDIERSIAFVKHNQIRMYNVFPLQLLPGSPLRNEAGEHGIDADRLPPYTVVKTRFLPQSQIQSYVKKSEVDHDEICFDLAQEFQLPRFAAFKLSESSVTAVHPTVAPVAKILISGAIDQRRFAEAEAGRIGSSVVMIFSNLEQSLASFVDLVEEVWHKNPFSLIMPVFEIKTSAELDDVKRLCRSVSAQNLVRKTVVKDTALAIEADVLAGFTLFDAFHIRAASDMAKVTACNSPNIMVDLSPHLDAVDLRTALALLFGTGKNIQYKNLAFNYLHHLIRQQLMGQPGSIHAPVDMGRIIVVDAEGRALPHLSLNNRMALEIAHMQMLFMRFIRGSGEESTGVHIVMK